MAFEDFQDDRHGGHLGMILAILNLHVAPMTPTSLGSIRLSVREQMWFQDGHPGRTEQI